MLVSGRRAVSGRRRPHADAVTPVTNPRRLVRPRVHPPGVGARAPRAPCLTGGRRRASRGEPVRRSGRSRGAPPFRPRLPLLPGLPPPPLLRLPCPPFLPFSTLFCLFSPSLFRLLCLLPLCLPFSSFLFPSLLPLPLFPLWVSLLPHPRPVFSLFPLPLSFSVFPACLSTSLSFSRFPPPVRLYTCYLHVVFDGSFGDPSRSQVGQRISLTEVWVGSVVSH